MSLIIWSSAPEKCLREAIGAIVLQEGVPHTLVTDMVRFPLAAKSGDVVLCCGGKAFEVLQSLGLYPKNRSVTSCREKVVAHKGATVLPTFDPSVIGIDYARLPEIQWDTRLAIRYLTTGQGAPIVGDYYWVESLHEVVARVDEKYAATGKPVEVAFDLETTSLNPYDPNTWIVSAFFTVDAGKSYGVYFEKGEVPVRPEEGKALDELNYWEGLWAQLNWLLTTPKISLRGANLKYDCHWLVQKFDINCTNQKFDTMLAGSLLNENRGNSLKLHAKIMTPLGGYESGMDRYDKGHMEEVPKEDLLIYAGGDTDATYRVAIRMKEELLLDKQLTNFYVKLLQPSVKVFEKMERTGMLVNPQVYYDLEVELQGEVARLQQEMINCLPNKLRIKYWDSIAKAIAEGKSPFKADLLQEYLFSKMGLNLTPRFFTAKTGKASTSGDHLMLFMDNPDAAPFVTAFSEMTEVQKVLSTYVVGFLKHLHPGNKFHPSYYLAVGSYDDRKNDAGATTGRTSCSNPSVQTIPKRGKWVKKLRQAFIAPPGKTLLSLDFSQGELRIAAVLAKEPTMLDAYASGLDLHAITAAHLSGNSVEDFMLLPDDQRDLLRSAAKASNFGLIYGMGAKRYVDYARTAYGVTMTLEQGTDNRNAFFDKYSKLLDWHAEYKGFAHRHGYVRSPLGRIRHLPLINSRDRMVSSQSERMAVNAPVQSCLSDMMQLAMVHIDREYGTGYGLDFYLMCHDSITVTVPEEDAIIWARRLKEIMENLPLLRDFGFDSPIKFVADAEYGVTMSAMVKVKTI